MGCASLEETGKGYIAFSAKGRNLKSPSVQHAIKAKFEDHPSKIISALICLLKQKQKELTKEDLAYFIDLSVHLQHGREKAMYVDVREDGTVTLLRKIIRPKAAFDCIRLAKDSLEATTKYVSTNPPDSFSSFHDKMLCISTKTINKLTNRGDFWEYYLDMLSRDSKADFIKAIVKYHDEYFYKKKKFLDSSNK